ncbi:MAG: hypothetical protein EXS59_02685 [Candidatus Taylorbacteria bacterium]|nr:hypothetical protein [Candidatus Taylorbacteria bacterium]
MDDKVVLELKQGNYFFKKNIEQTYSYLKAINVQVGIIAQFTSEGVKYRRGVNV